MRMKCRAMTRIMQICIVLVVMVSAFFYAPMEVFAEEVLTGSTNVSLSADSFHYQGLSPISLGTYNFGDSLDDDSYYEVAFDSTLYFSSTIPVRLRHYFVRLNVGDSPYIVNFKMFDSSVAGELTYFPPFTESHSVIGLGSDLKNVFIEAEGVLLRSSNGLGNISAYFSFDNILVTKISASDYNDYQNGFDDGYQEGQTDGYNNGYSQGFVDGEESGFQAGQNSVDTQSYYNAGFSAGYDEGFSDGYSTGFNKGYEEGRNVNGTISTPKYLTGYASELVSGNDFYVGSNAIADVEHFIIGTEIETLRWFDTQLGTVHVDSDINYRIPIASSHGSSVYVEGDGIHQKFSLILSPYLVHDSVSGTLLKDCSISEVYVIYQGNKYYATLSYGSDGSVNAFFDFYAPLDIGHTVLSNTSHDVHVKMQCSALLANDSGANGHMYTGVFITPKIHFVCRTSDFQYSVFYSDELSGSIIQDQTQQFIDSTQNQTDQLTNGFDSSAGQSVNDNFKASVNDYHSAEDSLFTSAKSGLDNFEFIDFTTITGMVTSLSFVTSIMSSIYLAMGGDLGPSGIILAVLFSVMIVSMTVGLYRYYVSNGRSSRKGGD